MRNTAITMVALSVACGSAVDVEVAEDSEGFDSDAEYRQGDWGEEGPGCDPESAEGPFNPELPEEPGEIASEQEWPSRVPCEDTVVIYTNPAPFPQTISVSARDLCDGDARDGAKSKISLFTVTGFLIGSEVVDANWNSWTIDVPPLDSVEISCAGDNKSACEYCEYWLTAP